MNRLLSAPYNKHKIGKKQAVAILFIMPFFVLYSIFTIFPVFQGIYVSLCNWNLMGKTSFVGIENYKKMMQDKNFYLSCIHTVKFVVFLYHSWLFYHLSFHYWQTEPFVSDAF